VTKTAIIRACAAQGVDFYVSKHDSGMGAIQAEWPTRGMHMYLYECRRVRAEAAQ
jgi:hypothetical protein